MKFSVDGQQKGFFEQHHVILFESLVSEEDLAKLAEYLEKDRHQKKEKRDFWRHSLEIRSYSSRRAWVETVSSLVEEKPLRMGFDQWVSFEDNAPYFPLWEGTASLNEMSSYRNIVCSLFIPLLDNPSGQGLLVDPAHPIPLQNWLPSRTPCYMVTYLSLKAQYVLNRSDPFAVEMLKLGYTTGDRVREDLNPIVYR